MVETTQVLGITYQRELVKCGKKQCKRCSAGPAHGPYWYAYRWKPGRRWQADGDDRNFKGRLVSQYIGKELKQLSLDVSPRKAKR